jgi:ABC-2 type transport system ATP-binding protein
MGVDVEADALLVRTADYTGFAHQVGTVAKQASITLLEVQPTDESLEHVFAYLVAR